MIWPDHRPDPQSRHKLVGLLICTASASVTVWLVWAAWPVSAWVFLAALAACVVWGLR